jgi:muramoyltetrapeptide carboxypeptidase LdcA involved in peptidoglycan recycling
MHFATLPKLQPGDSVGIVSPSFVAPAVFPMEYELGLSRLREVFGLNPVPLPHAANPSATTNDKINDLIQAFTDPSLKAVITTLGGDHQVEYVHKLPTEPFKKNPKPFFGYSDNTHLSNFLFRHGIPSFYGGALYTEFAMQGSMDPFTVRYLQAALFTGGQRQLEISDEFNDQDLPWGDEKNLAKRRRYQLNEGWHWDGQHDGQGYSWGGCVESLDELLRHNHEIPSLSDFERIVLILETCEELSSATYVMRVLRALGERGILARAQGVLVGRPKAWSFEQPNSDDAKIVYKKAQREVVLETVRRYNPTAPIVQNLDLGHTAPTLCIPYGGEIEIQCDVRSITARY